MRKKLEIVTVAAAQSNLENMNECYDRVNWSISDICFRFVPEDHFQESNGHFNLI